MVGNTPNYSRFDIIRCFLRLGKKISRQQLAKELELGEGTIRSILDILKDRGLILSDTQGHTLTQKGTEFVNRINSIIQVKPVQLALYPKRKSVAALVSSNAKITYEHRDIAVKSGAQGALIVLVKDKKLERPDASVEADFIMLEHAFHLDDTKIMIITFSDSFRDSEIAAFSVAAALSKDFYQIMDKTF